MDVEVASPSSCMSSDGVTNNTDVGVFLLGEQYINGEWDAPQLDEHLYKIFLHSKPAGRFTRVYTAFHVLKDILLNPQKGSGVYEVGKRHYDLGNDLFAAMLDTTMTYTCGLWERATNLQEAQEAKLARICEKLQLSPGMSVLDIGCGWGNFAHFASTRYGVKVHGITISVEQARAAQERCAGLPVQISIQDYREVQGSFDRIVSIEMIEAVGRRNLTTFFETASRLLKKDGLFMLQAISAETLSRHSLTNLDQYILWIVKHIFPNGYLPKMPDLVNPCRSNLILEDMHGFGPDYDKTLMAWDANFRRSWPALSGKYNDRFYRMWRFYLCGCAALFRARMVQVYQVLYRKV